MIELVRQFAEGANVSEKSGIAVLGFDFKSFLLQLITFIILYALLRKYAFGSIVKILEKRRVSIDKGVHLGIEMEKEKSLLDEQIQAKLKEARKTADLIIAEAHLEAQARAKQTEDKLSAKAATMVAEAEAKIAEETLRARKALRNELGLLVADATEAIIHEKLDAQKDKSLIERVLSSKTA